VKHYGMLREGKDLNAEIQRLKEFRNPRCVNVSWAGDTQGQIQAWAYRVAAFPPPLTKIRGWSWL